MECLPFCHWHKAMKKPAKILVQMEYIPMGSLYLCPFLETSIMLAHRTYKINICGMNGKWMRFLILRVNKSGTFSSGLIKTSFTWRLIWEITWKVWDEINKFYFLFHLYFLNWVPSPHWHCLWIDILFGFLWMTNPYTMGDLWL